jgi:[ribosomal protein S18]-alanine N-acetyltransferase
MNDLFRLTPVTAAEAALICRWTYGPGYRMCDFTPADLAAMLDPRYLYHAVRRGAGLAGVACFGEAAQVVGGPYAGAALDLGLSLHPALVGQGLGKQFVAVVAAFAADTFAPPLLRLSVATTNDRAIRVFEGAGFVVERRFAGIARGGAHPFLLMTRVASSGGIPGTAG